MLRKIGWTAVAALALMAGAGSGEAQAYTHGRPVLWPARWIGYGWSDGYHAHPCPRAPQYGPGYPAAWLLQPPKPIPSATRGL